MVDGFAGYVLGGDVVERLHQIELVNHIGRAHEFIGE